jgi:hypothetical protein
MRLLPSDLADDLGGCVAGGPVFLLLPWLGEPLWSRKIHSVVYLRKKINGVLHKSF